MAGSEISSLILTIAAITLATIIAASLFAVSFGISESIEQSADNNADQLLQEFTIINVGLDNASSTSLQVFVVNTGSITLQEASFYILLDNKFVYYNDDTEIRYWNTSYPGKSNPDSNLNPDDLISINIYLTTSIGSGSHTILISTGGYSDEYWFSV